MAQPAARKKTRSKAPAKAQAKEKSKSKGLVAIKSVLISLLCLEILFGGGVLALVTYLNSFTSGDIPIIEATPAHTVPPKPTMDPGNGNPGNGDGKEEEYNGDGTETDPGKITTAIYARKQIDANVLNIMVVGNDARPNEGNGRSDATMMLSYNKTNGKAKMISVMRDQLVPIERKEKTVWNKFNAAYSWGGVGLTINTFNNIYDMDVQKYLVVGFEGLIELVDTLGGVEVKITKGESDYYKREAKKDPAMESGATIGYGDNVKLTGKQALVHARNRHYDSDWGRTRRQRDIMMAIFNKVKSTFKNEPTALIPLLDQVKKIIKTNLTANEMYDLAISIMKDKNLNIETSVMPFEGTYKNANYNKMFVFDTDLDENAKLLRKYIYGN